MNTKLNKLKNFLKGKARQTGQFILDNKVMILQMAAIAVAIPAMGECSVESMASADNLDPLVSPMTKIAEAITGPIPKVFTVVSGAVAGIAWGAGWEQNIMQRAAKCAGGGAIATACGEGLEWAGLTEVDACLFI
ncbi:MAG: hypothetical protein IJ849_09880 [Selenomonadaceae bacterium]|nr:hypothetical protein [Selenomonadaceae bacterium]